LNDALNALNLRLPTYIDHPLAGAPNGTLIRVVQIRQLRQCTTAGSSCYKPIAQFVKDFYQGVLHRQPNSGELSTWTATLSEAQAQGATQLIAAAQSLGSTLFNSTEYAGLNTTNAQFVADLYTGYLQRTHDLSGYNFWLNELDNNGDTRAHQIQAFSLASEFTGNAAALCATSAIGGGLRYVLSDAHGSARAVMSNNGTASTVIARYDYLPFGEELTSGIGLRTSGQGYGAPDTNRQKYGLTQRDDVSGLDHTWWRKYESLSGRWTSPDPYNGSLTIANPQSFNRYSYTQNDPVNFVDPSGLLLALDCSFLGTFVINDRHRDVYICRLYEIPDFGSFGPIRREPNPRGGGPRRGRPQAKPKVTTPTPPQKTQAQKQQDYNNCYTRELAPVMNELRVLMNRGLRNTIIAGVGGGGITSVVKLMAGGIGISFGVLGGLYQWRDQIEDFGRDKLDPARAAAKEKCTKEAGL
jgi:RHS repeat-associated protein